MTKQEYQHRSQGLLDRIRSQSETIQKTRVALPKEMPPLCEWAGEHISLRGKPFSFDGHEYLREIYEQQHPYKVFEKAAQVAISTYTLIEAFWLCESLGAKVIYYFPTDVDISDFSNDRADPMIEESPHLTSLMGNRSRGKDNVGLKHVGRGSVYFRGMFTKAKVKAVDGDALVFDELDEANQEHKAFGRDRILHSELQWIRELSQPSIPDYGIDVEFQNSDQRYWHLRCPGCGRWTCPDLETDVNERGIPVPLFLLPVPSKNGRFQDGQRWYRGCVKCGELLDMSAGQWVAKRPSAMERRGYHVSQLYTQIQPVDFPNPADKIMYILRTARKTMDKLRAVISILGFPYAGERAPVTDAILDACEGEHGLETDAEYAYIGIDVGDVMHIVVGTLMPDEERIRVHWMEQTEDWGRLDFLMQTHNVIAAVIDAMPYKASAKRFARAFPGQIHLQYFGGDTTKTGEEGEDDQAVPKVRVDRTESLDDTTQMLRDGDFILPSMARLDAGDSRTLDTFRAHCKMLVKDIVENSAGVKRFAYKTNVPNHFGMALNSLRIATEISPYQKFDYVSAGRRRSAGLRAEGAY